MGLSTGRLNRRIEIMRATTTLDRGEPSGTTWSVYATPWAEVLGQNGREALIAHVLEGISVFRITMRYRRDLLPSDQIRLDGVTDLNITPPYDPDGSREQLVIIASTDGAQKTS